MLSIAARRSSLAINFRTQISCLFSTESVSSSISSNSEPPPPQKPASTKSRTSSFNPRPRPAKSHQHQALNLPSTFGRNQQLPVSNSTRTLLESVVAEFNAPIRYAFAYGSGVFEQDGYASSLSSEAGEKPMLDFIFAVTHADHWHSINMSQHPGHYALHARLLGSSFVTKVEEISPGVWFNTYVKMNDVTIKYGVTTVDNLCADLLNWRSLYLAGRMHKPLRIIKDDARVRLTQQVNLTSAIRATLLTLPEEFSEVDLFERIAGISYSGDPRMLLPTENRGKVSNIVRKQTPQFKELYYRLVDVSPHARSAHLKKLPSNLLHHVTNAFPVSSNMPSREADESAYWNRLAGDGRLPATLHQEMSRIVRYPATVQSLKGIVSAGISKSARYTAQKVGKWWRGSSKADIPADRPS